MEKAGFYFYLLVLVVGLCYDSGAANPTAMDFIKASCRTTLHPALCVTCLSKYAGSIQMSDHSLAKAAISVSLNEAKSAAVFVSKLARVAGIKVKPREYQAVKDCMSTLSNSVAGLGQSVQELGQMGRSTGQDFEWHMSNVETWVGSALTNQNICGRGFADKSMNGHGISQRMVYVSQVTSNALALVNRFAARHRKGIHIHMP